MKRNNKKGFTIVELTIVIAVIAILAAVLIPTFSSIVDKANTSSDIQLVRQANMILAALDVYDGEIDEATAIEELQANGITLETPTNTENEFHYDPAEKCYVIWSKAEKKIIYPENSEFTPSYRLTYDWNLPQAGKPFQKGQKIDTGYYINWDEDFTITEEVDISSLGSRYLLLGCHSDHGEKAEYFHLEINAEGKIRIRLKAKDWFSTETVKAGTVRVTYKWTALTDTFQLEVIQDEKKIIDQTCSAFPLTGKSQLTMCAGAIDHRTSQVFGEIQVKSLHITQKVAYGEELTLPEVTSNIDSYTCNGWFKAATGGDPLSQNDTMPAADTTIYAQWNQT